LAKESKNVVEKRKRLDEGKKGGELTLKLFPSVAQVGHNVAHVTHNCGKQQQSTDELKNGE
jgi:hypothetical protein